MRESASWGLGGQESFGEEGTWGEGQSHIESFLCSNLGAQVLNPIASLFLVFLTAGYTTKSNPTGVVPVVVVPGSSNTSLRARGLVFQS